jgi:hypothetical protein
MARSKVSKEFRWLMEEVAELSESAQWGIAEQLRIMITTWRKIDAKVAEAIETQPPPPKKGRARP